VFPAEELTVWVPGEGVELDRAWAIIYQQFLQMGNAGMICLSYLQAANCTARHLGLYEILPFTSHLTYDVSCHVKSFDNPDVFRKSPLCTPLYQAVYYDRL
jgi:hypothetical protein